MRKCIVVAWLLLLSGGIGLLFWHNEWIYSLPTPVPAHYQAIRAGTPVTIGASFKAAADKPLFLHFFNPDCPCSRFNIQHFKSLVKQYGHQASFVIVPVTKENYTAQDIQSRFGLDIPVVFDTTIAAACGVYSTPQAVILDERRCLFYRGNYNRSRYCTDKHTNYAQAALDSLLDHKLHPVFDPFALKAYGCRLPTCTQ